jgi:hypothetical protein
MSAGAGAQLGDVVSDSGEPGPEELSSHFGEPLVIFNSVDTALKLTKDVVNVVSVSVGSLNFRHDISATLASTKESL